MYIYILAGLAALTLGALWFLSSRPRRKVPLEILPLNRVYYEPGHQVSLVTGREDRFWWVMSITREGIRGLRSLELWRYRPEGRRNEYVRLVIDSFGGVREERERFPWTALVERDEVVTAAYRCGDWVSVASALFNPPIGELLSLPRRKYEVLKE